MILATEPALTRYVYTLRLIRSMYWGWTKTKGGHHWKDGQRGISFIREEKNMQNDILLECMRRSRSGQIWYEIKKCLCLKTKNILKWERKNIQTVNFIILKSMKRQRNTFRRGLHFDIVEASGDTGYIWNVSTVIDFRKKKVQHNKLRINLDRSVFTLKYQISRFIGKTARPWFDIFP